MLSDFLNFNTIVVATDFSSAANAALRHAMRFPKSRNADLILVHVVDPVGNSSEDMDVSLHDTIYTARAELKKMSSELALKGVPNRWVLRHGNVRDSILQVAQEYQADLLVLGSKGFVIGHAGDGTTAEEIIRAAPCPVLTIVSENRGTDDAAGHPPLILFPTDFSEASRVAFSYAVSFALQTQGTLLLVHALEYRYLETNTKPPSVLPGNALAALLAEAHLSGLQAESEVRSGDASHMILALAAQRRADYILLAVRHGDLVDGTRLHGRLRHLIRQSPCPILTMCPPNPLQALTTPQRARMAWEMMQARDGNSRTTSGRARN